MPVHILSSPPPRPVAIGDTAPSYATIAKESARDSAIKRATHSWAVRSKGLNPPVPRSPGQADIPTLTRAPPATPQPKFPPPRPAPRPTPGQTHLSQPESVAERTTRQTRADAGTARDPPPRTAKHPRLTTTSPPSSPRHALPASAAQVRTANRFAALQGEPGTDAEMTDAVPPPALADGTAAGGAPSNART